MHNIEARPGRPKYNLKFNLYFKKRPLRSVNVFAHDPLAETYTLMHNIRARRHESTARRRPNYNLKFNLYYKNRPLRSVNVFIRRALDSSTRSKYSTIIETYEDISNIKKYYTRGPGGLLYQYDISTYQIMI